MRVLLDCRMAAWSGVGRYTQGLVRALAELPGIEVVQMVAEGSPVPAQGAEAVPARHHPFSPSGALEYGRIARRVGSAVTHSLHFPVPTPATHPLVVTIQDLTPLIVPGVMPSALKRAVYRRMVHHAMAASDRVITPSRHSAHDAAAFAPRLAAKIRPVLLAADDFTAGEMGALPSWLEGQQYVLSMGNTRVHKDLPTLMRAFAALPADGSLLVLVGKDPGGYVASILGDAPVARRVRFTGAVDDATLRALYAGARAFAFPSRYEGFGLPPLEAMSLGTPVVTSNAGSLPEVVGDAGLTVQPGEPAALADALARILHDESLAGKLRALGTTRAASFSWARTAEATAAVYAEVAR